MAAQQVLQCRGQVLKVGRKGEKVVVDVLEQTRDGVGRGCSGGMGRDVVLFGAKVDVDEVLRLDAEDEAPVLAACLLLAALQRAWCAGGSKSIDLTQQLGTIGEQPADLDASRHGTLALNGVVLNGGLDDDALGQVLDGRLVGDARRQLLLDMSQRYIPSASPWHSPTAAG